MIFRRSCSSGSSESSAGAVGQFGDQNDVAGSIRLALKNGLDGDGAKVMASVESHPRLRFLFMNSILLPVVSIGKKSAKLI